ncbi:MAG: protein kinase [Candidatus Aminicenantes bacterium]|nr:protein kinase [Candidatus Aminicenantes bacterium]
MTEQRIGKYEIIGEIGRGAMGVVYKARDPLIDRIVALKTIRFDMYAQPDQRDEAQKRFLREAKSAGQLSHPHIATIYEVGEDQGQAFIAMEYIEGRSLEAWLADKRRWSVEEAVRFIIEVAEALDSTHKKNIIHRDIKPGNILVDAEGHPHLVDFGIARIPASTLTQTTAVLGTPFYMAPEQVAARKIDHRVDIFALGAIFYEMLTLEKPFTGDNLTTIIYKIMNEEPIPLRQFKGNLPAALDPIVRKLLAKDPDARYQSCRALANDLIRFADEAGFDVGRRPQPETSLTETKKLKRPAEAVKPAADTPSRKPLIIVGVAMAAVVVIAGGILLLTRNNGRLPGQKPESPAVSGPVEPGRQEAAAKPDPKSGAKGQAQIQAGGTTPPPASKEEPAPARKQAPAQKQAPTQKQAPAQIQAPAASNAATNAVKTDPGNPAAKPGEVKEPSPSPAAAEALARDIALRTAEADIKTLLAAYLDGLKKGKEAAFYQANASAALTDRLKRNLELMDKVYDKLEGAAGDLKLDTRSAQSPRFIVRASFPHTITGRTRSNWKRETIFQGSYTWTLEKDGPRWIISDLAFEAK